jgi:hypothetical protein
MFKSGNKDNNRILELESQLQSCLDYLKKDICIDCSNECSSFNTCQMLSIIRDVEKVLYKQSNEDIPKFISQYPNEIGFND